MKEIGPIIEKLLQQKKMWQQYRQHSIVEQWAEIAGKEISAVTRAEKIVKGKLMVVAKDSTWVYHLTLLKPKLLEQIKKNTGSKVVGDIYFQVGELHRQDNQPVTVNSGEEGQVLTESGSSSSNNTESSFLNGIRKLKQFEQTLIKQSPEEE